MTTLTILSDEEIQIFESPPRFTASERKYFFAIPEWAEEVFRRLSAPENRIGFILQLGYFRATGKFYPKSLFYPEDAEFVRERLDFGTGWEAPKYPDRMMQRHRRLILTNLGYRPFSQAEVPFLTDEARQAIEQQLRLKDVFGNLLDTLERQRIEVPSYSALSTIITAVFRQHEKDLLRRLQTSLSAADRELLDSLLASDAGVYARREAISLKRSQATLLKKFYQSIKPAKIHANIEDLLFIKELFTRFQPLCITLNLSRQVIEHFALMMIKVQNFQIERRNEKRYLYLLCFLVHQYCILQDMLIDTLVRVSQGAVNKAKKEQREKYFAEREEHLKDTEQLVRAVESTEGIVEAIKRIVFTNDMPDTEKVSHLRVLLRRGNRSEASRTKELLARQRRAKMRASYDGDYFNAFESQSLWLQKRASEIVKHLGFNEDTSQKPTGKLGHSIDVMMRNTIVKPDWFSTDTHGVTPLTFATMHFLGVFFAPRIADMQKRSRVAFIKRRRYQEQGFVILPDRTVNEGIIEEVWEDILRFMTTIILKVTPGSQLFQKLNSRSHKHPLYQGLKEFGEVIETIFILRDMDEVDIRQQREKELNKLEHINRFSKAVFNDHNHMFLQGTREEQLVADGMKRLIENAIIGYNYLDLSERSAQMPEGRERDAFLNQIRRSSMAAWHHIYMDGEYDFSDERVNTITRFHMTKILALKLMEKQ